VVDRGLLLLYVLQSVRSELLLHEHDVYLHERPRGTDGFAEAEDQLGHHLEGGLDLKICYFVCTDCRCGLC